jgi:predicted PurR-regulated permease PerM
MLNKEFSKLCTPARLYFVIAIISSVVALLSKVTLLAVFFKLVFAFIWTYILGWLCKKGYESLSWFLVLLPYIFMLLAVIGIMKLTKDQKSILNQLQLQGSFGKEYFTNKKMPPMKPMNK